MDLLVRRRSMMSTEHREIKPIQIIQNGNFVDWTVSQNVPDNWTKKSYTTLAIEDGWLSYTRTGSSNGMYQNVGGLLITGHKYYFAFQFKNNTATTGGIVLRLSSTTTSSTPNYISSGLTEGRKDAVVSFTSSWENGYVHLAATIGNKTSIFMKNIFAIDLTATFGAGNEPDLATCRTLFTEDYYEYYVGI